MKAETDGQDGDVMAAEADRAPPFVSEVLVGQTRALACGRRSLSWDDGRAQGLANQKHLVPGSVSPRLLSMVNVTF